MIGLVEELERCGVTCVPPPISNQLGPGSLDLRIGKVCSFKEPEEGCAYSIDSPPPLEKVNLDRGFSIKPNEPVLITTMEKISLSELPKSVGWITNKSSLARKGLSVTTQMLNPGQKGKITLLVENLSKFPVPIYRGDRIAQMVLISARDIPYWYKSNSTIDRIPNFSTLTLGSEFGILKGPETVENLTVSEGKPFVLDPGEFILGITREEVLLESKNVIGMLIRTNAHFYERVYVLEGLLNPGFKGKIVLEIKNGGNLPVELFPGEDIYRICYCPAFTFGSYASSKSKYVGVDKTSHPQL